MLSCIMIILRKISPMIFKIEHPHRNGQLLQVAKYSRVESKCDEIFQADVPIRPGAIGRGAARTATHVRKETVSRKDGMMINICGALGVT